jgi:hypothetical protein
MNRALTYALAFVVLTAAVPLHAQQWEYRYAAAETSDQMSVCMAGIYYDDGPFAMRVYEETMDFYLEHDELTLPPSELLGDVIFHFKNVDFVLPAYSGKTSPTANHMFLIPRESDYEDILQSLRYGDQFQIVFPDGSGYSIELSGSNAAIVQAFECWSQNATGGGGGGGNPFEGPSSRNPFERN